MRYITSRGLRATLRRDGRYIIRLTPCFCEGLLCSKTDLRSEVSALNDKLRDTSLQEVTVKKFNKLSFVDDKVRGLK